MISATQKTNKFKLLKAYTGEIKDISVKPFALKEPFIDFASRFAANPGTVVLMSGGDLDSARYHVLAIKPWLTMKSFGSRLFLRTGDGEISIECDPFEALRHVLCDFATPFENLDIPVAAGLFGYLSYDLKDFIEVLPKTTICDHHLPDLCFFAPSAVIIHDKAKNRTQLCVPNRVDLDLLKTGDDIETTEAMLNERCLSKDGFSGGSAGLTSSFLQTEYVAAVKRIKEYIVAGDIYQVNLSQRFETDFSGNPFAMFKTLYQTAPAPFYAYINAGDHHVISTSPERFICRRKMDVETRPIKGTRPRGKTTVEDHALRDELQKSKKDDAELSMIVDLMRNDLGRVCRGGTVTVAEHKRIESYRNVFHLVSVVKGKLRPGVDAVDLIKATFPGGSITGCPKIRAMEIIDEIEPSCRHIYTGSIGYISFHDTLDLSIAIRTATVFKEKIFFSVGGGVVFDSDPEDEFEETLHKGRSLTEALNARQDLDAPCEFVWHNGKIVSIAQAQISVSDLGVQYGLGFFETIRVNKTKPLYLKEHMNRFDIAWDKLFKTLKPDLTWDPIIRMVIDKNGLENETVAVKIMATYGDRTEIPFSHTLTVFTKKYHPRAAIVKNSGLDLAVYPHPRQTPLADHKTLNYAYYFLAQKWAQENSADEALILNPDGSVSETNTANIILIKEKKVIKPESPHVLSGIMETAVIRQLVKWGFSIETRKVMPREVFLADQVLLTNSLMGAVPVLSFDGKSLKQNLDLCQKLGLCIS